MARNPSKKVDKHRHDEDKLGAAGGIKKADGKAGKGKAKGKNKRKDRIETAQKRRKIKGAKQKFWAVKVGRAPGVYTSEAAYREQVEGFTGADARSFRTEKLANAYLIDSVVKLVTEEVRPPVLRVLKLTCWRRSMRTVAHAVGLWVAACAHAT